AQIDILETMTPSSFSSFRDRLETASGFQSVQFREIEFVLGYKRESTLKYVKPDFPGADRLQQRLRERTVIDHFYDFLEKRGAKKGTGGSPGVPFLKESLFKPIFHDLWAIRHEM